MIRGQEVQSGSASGELANPRATTSTRLDGSETLHVIATMRSYRGLSSSHGTSSAGSDGGAEIGGFLSCSALSPQSVPGVAEAPVDRQLAHRGGWMQSIGKERVGFINEERQRALERSLEDWGIAVPALSPVSSQSSRSGSRTP